ncbi:MAG TPA: protein translocase subunit SecF [Xanthomonadales bacterium]|nr:protein translocase subunit SecF [Xanthomonadales bacterium]
MFELFSHDAKIPFTHWGKFTVPLSIALMLVSAVLLFKPGFNLGLDFTGGTLIELHMDKPVELPQVRKVLADAGYDHAVVQSFGGTRDVLVRLSPREAEAGEKAAAAKATPAATPAATPSATPSATPAADATERKESERAVELGRTVHDVLAKGGLPSELKRNEFVGPQVGKELSEDGLVAIVVVLVGILIYIAFRFQLKFGAAAIIGEIHDVLVTGAIFVLIGREFDTTVLAGLLSVAGYSINDKVVVFDRIREVFRATSKVEPEDVIDRSINTTLSRTIMTSVVTALAMLGLFLFGGPSVENFAMVMLIGIVVGTLSSIFFSAQLLLWFHVSKRDLMPKARDLSELERRP